MQPPAAPPVPDGSPPIRRTVPRPGVGARLHFGWAVVWTALWVLVFLLPILLDSWIRPGTKSFKRWMTPWARIILGGVGIRVRTEMRAPLPTDRPVVLIANHQNALDILTTSAGIPHPFGFTAKAGLRRMPLIGTVLAHTACVFVDRSSPRRAAQSLVEAGAEIRAGHSVLVFAEGRRTWQSDLAPFLRGAFLLAVEAGVPLVPVVLDGNVGLLDERHGASRPGAARVVIGPPLDTSTSTPRDVPALMSEVRAWMTSELGEEEPARETDPVPGEGEN